MITKRVWYPETLESAWLWTRQLAFHIRFITPNTQLHRNGRLRTRRSLSKMSDGGAPLPVGNSTYCGQYTFGQSGLSRDSSGNFSGFY